MWKDFKAFAFKGNVVDMAVGVMIGGAFGKIVTSVVNDLFMPVISLITGNIDFNNLFVAMDGNTYATVDAATEAGVAVFKYGTFISTVVDFLLMAICVFAFVKLISKMHKKKEEAPAPEPAPVRHCPFCKMEIADDATRCPHCTSELAE
ncbi:MAG: large conductance mechanosensitive channel protein MscL, partial [Clostridia bacterium]|nr:large conductance mechanosensitive channel protein MscL [Clostridia bacterium]